MKTRSPDQRVVVTGMGMVTPLGIGVTESWSKLVAGESGISPMPSDITEATGVYAAGIAPNYDLSQHPALSKLERSDLRNMHRSAEIALIATHEALKNAGLLSEEQLRVDQGLEAGLGVKIGTGIGGAITLLNTAQNLRDGKNVRPAEILNTLPNRPAEEVSMKAGAQAFLGGEMAECATGNANIISAAQNLRDGAANIVIAGGVETPIYKELVAQFASTGAVSKNSDYKNAPRPFDSAADGLVMSEGAGILILETLEHAQKRGTTILAELVAYGMSADADKPTLPNVTGSTLAIVRTLENAAKYGINIGDLMPYINAHATSTSSGDPKEMEAISRVFTPESVLNVNSTKGATGHMMGGTSSIEAIFSILALREGIIPPTLNLNNPITEAQGWPLSNQAKVAAIRYALNLSFGFGGINNATLWARHTRD